MSGPNNNNPNPTFSQGLTGGLSLSAPSTIAVPGNFDPITLQQSIINHVRAQQAAPSIDTGADYSAVVMGWAEALGELQNPLNSSFYTNDQALFGLVGQGGGGSGAVSTPTLLFNIVGVVSVGSWVYQNGSDAVSIVDSSTVSTGPALGVVVELPTATTARVQNVGSFIYDSANPSGFGFLPMTPDTVYYARVGGEITDSPTPPAGGFIQEIGYSKTSYELVLNIQEPIFV